MKKLLALLLISVLIFTLCSCEVLETVKGLIIGEQTGTGNDTPDETCEHVDDDNDGECDKCGESYGSGEQIVPGTGDLYDPDGSVGGGVELPIIPIPTNPEVEDETEGEE